MTAMTVTHRHLPVPGGGHRVWLELGPLRFMVVTHGEWYRPHAKRCVSPATTGVTLVLPRLTLRILLDKFWR
jgi:hypothetical protein